VLLQAPCLVPSVGNRDQWKNNGSAGLNGNAIELTRPLVRKTDEGLWKSQAGAGSGEICEQMTDVNYARDLRMCRTTIIMSV
jgi:hypothetical protein